MRITTSHRKSSHPAKHLNDHHSARKSRAVISKIANIYSSSKKSVKKNPYRAVSILLSIGIISSLIFWFRFLK